MAAIQSGYVRRAMALRTSFVGVFVVGLLSACNPIEPILPGQRENIRAVLQDPAVAAQGEQQANQSRAISLPRQTLNSNWEQAQGSAAFRISNPAAPATPNVVWTARIGAGDSRKQRITANPVVSGGTVFTLDAGATVTATSTSGATVWSANIRPVRDGEGEATGGGLAVDGNQLFVSLGYGSLVALNVATGDVLWRQQLDATGSGTPTVFGNLVYLTAGDDTGWAVEKDTGRIAWIIGSSTNINNVLGAPAPAVTDDFVVFGFGSGEVQAAFRRGGLRRWGTSVVGERFGRALGNVSDITSAPTIVGERVYVGNQSGRIVALNLGSGERIWTASEGAVNPVISFGGSVFAISDLNELLRLDASDGSRIWAVELPKFTKDRPRRQSEIFAHHGPVLAGGRLLVASGDGLLRSFDPTDGSLVGTVEIPGGATTAPVIAGGTIYVVSSAGLLHALR